MPALLGGLTALFFALGLAAVPMLRDQGPVERLGGRVGGGREPTGRHSGGARLVGPPPRRVGARVGARPRPPPPPPPPRKIPHTPGPRGGAPARVRGPE